MEPTSAVVLDQRFGHARRANDMSLVAIEHLHLGRSQTTVDGRNAAPPKEILE